MCRGGQAGHVGVHVRIAWSALFFVKIPISNGSIRTQQATPRVSVVDSLLFRIPSQVQKKSSRYKAILPTVVVFDIFACPQERLLIEYLVHFWHSCGISGVSDGPNDSYVDYKM